MRMIIKPMEKSRETMRIAPPLPHTTWAYKWPEQLLRPASRSTASCLSLPDPTWSPTPAVLTWAAGSWQHNAQPIHPSFMKKLGFHLIQPDDSLMGQAGKFAVVAPESGARSPGCRGPSPSGTCPRAVVLGWSEDCPPLRLYQDFPRKIWRFLPAMAAARPACRTSLT